MDAGQLQSGLTENTLQHLDEAAGLSKSKRRLLLKVTAELADDSDIPVLEDLFNNPGFTAYLRKKRTASPSRLEKSLERFIRRVTGGISPERVGKVAGIMAGKDYEAVERTFFRHPVDRDAHEIFEFNALRVGEQREDRLKEYIDLYLSDTFSYLRRDYRRNLELYRDIMSILTDALLGSRDREEYYRLVSLLTSVHIRDLVELAESQVEHREFIMLLTEAFYSGSDLEALEKNLSVYAKRYNADLQYEKHARRVYLRLKSIWAHILHLDLSRTGLFRSFLKYFGDPRDDLESFIWDTAFTLPPEKIVRVMTLLASEVFVSIKQYYQNESQIIRFLIRNIVAVLAEAEIQDIGFSLYSIVLKLLMGLKVDRQFLRRRADFFVWMKQQTTSVMIELQVIRIIIFEYIFLALHLVDIRYGMKMTKFIDATHGEYCRVLDEEYTSFEGRQKGKDAVFFPLLELIRNEAWKKYHERFGKDNRYLLDELRGIVETTDNEDEVFHALEKVERDELPAYHMALQNRFRNDPDNLMEALAADYWYRITFRDAEPYVKSASYPLIGGLRVMEGMGGAYTDGYTVFLPPYISYFKDPTEPILDNRNLTCYIGLTFHEAGHILAGSFAFDMSYYMASLEIPDLFRSIMNAFEDYRVEAFLVQLQVHHQVKEIIEVLNRYQSIRNFLEGSGTAFTFLTYIFDEAAGYNSELKEMEGYNELIEKILSMSMNSGRFRSLKDMAEYGVERLRNLDITNPLSVYRLSREFYEIMKHWPEKALRDVLDPNRMIKGIHRVEGDREGDGGPVRLTGEELDELYRQCNENPHAFLEGWGLLALAGLLEDGSVEADRDEYPPRNDIQQILGKTESDYDHEGTIDFSRRTKADDLLAENAIMDSHRKKPARKEGKSGGKEKDTKGKKQGKKKKVYSINPRTGSRTRLSEIEVYPISSIDSNYFTLFNRWNHISNTVYRLLSRLLPSIEEEHDTSPFDGEMNMEMVIEALSDRSRMDMVEIFDIYRESRRSLDVAIGLDASGSTAANIDSVHGSDITIMDIEKAFAIIFGRALEYLADDLKLFAFNSWTSTNIYRFESVDAVSSLYPDAANRDGDFIRFVTQELKQSDAEVKYFFLISDGSPAAMNYDGKQALDDTLIAMRETVAEGIRLIYFNCDAGMPYYFESFAREATYARHFNDPSQLLPVIPEMVNTIVKSIW